MSQAATGKEWFQNNNDKWFIHKKKFDLQRKWQSTLTAQSLRKQQKVWQAGKGGRGSAGGGRGGGVEEEEGMEEEEEGAFSKI